MNGLNLSENGTDVAVFSISAAKATVMLSNIHSLHPMKKTMSDVHQMNLSLVCAVPQGFISDKWPPTTSCVTQVRGEYIYTQHSDGSSDGGCVCICVWVLLCVVNETAVKRLSL